MIICDKEQADLLKSDAWLDEVVGNPIQTQPKGEVFHGRLGLTFRDTGDNLETRVHAWASRKGIQLAFGKNITLNDGALMVDGLPVHENYDACILALPIHSLACDDTARLEKCELSIYYFQIKDKLTAEFPAYYVLCHDQQLKSSRIVHYDAYRPEARNDPTTVIAVEAVHTLGNAPGADEIAAEITSIFRSARVEASFRFPHAVPVPIPTLMNQTLLNSVRDNIESQGGRTLIYFTGMRTDTGVFFSHHTIGLAYDSALDCCQQLL